MLTEAPPETLASPQRPAARKPRSRRRPYLRGFLLFTAGLVAAVWAADRYAGKYIRKTHGLDVIPWGTRTIVGWDVYEATFRAKRSSPGVSTIVLGDSVSRQLFLGRHEPNPQFRYLTSNQAISMAGQFYLLQDALKSCPNAKDVYLFYYPVSLENDLGPELSPDYFCAYFRKPRQIAEAFAVKRDFNLLASHVGHALVPNLLLLNSAARPAPEVFGSPVAKPAPPGGYQPLPADREPVLDAATALANPPAPTRPLWDPLLPAGQRRLVVASTMTKHFLPKIRDLCRSRGVRLHVLPCPCSDRETFRDADGIYDAPVFYMDRQLFADGVHFQEQFIDAARRRMVEEYHPNTLRERRYPTDRKEPQE